jgi:ATP-dependent helicase/nuclease subunit A
LAGVPEADALASRLLPLVELGDQARFLTGRALVLHLLSLPSVPKSYGFKNNWPSPEALTQARGIAAWLSTARARWSNARAAALHGRLVEILLGVATLYEHKKTRAGLLDFLDLLLKTRAALRDSEAVRRHLRERFLFVIVDEFQDSDPLQVDIAQRLTGERPGGLTVVGDAKQSIYRFRRADVALFQRIADDARTRPGHAVLQLTQNFRSRPAILRFVNRVFSELIQFSAEAGQTAYEALTPPPALDDGPAVIALRFGGDLLMGDELLTMEARALAAFVAEAARGGFSVRDPVSAATRPSRAGDVLVLTRRLTQVRHLEQAFEQAQQRFTVEGGKSFFDRQEVHEVLATLRAIDDPSDRVSLVAALRSSFLGVSDRDLVAYALAGGRLDLRVLVDAALPGADVLAPAMGLLVQLHAARTQLTASALLARLYDETRVLAALTLTRRGEGQIANLEKVIALARQAGELGVLTLRGFVRLLQERIESAREEPDLPSTRPGDPTTVRVLSIHKAKGLEAPIVALYDTADDYRVRAEVIPLWDQGRIAIGFRDGCQPPGWDELRAPEEKRAWAEARRLLYVAATRARDLLVVPQPPPSAKLGNFWKELIERLPPQGDADVRVLDADTLRDPSSEWARAHMYALSSAQGGDALALRWDAERAALLRSAAQRPLRPISVTRAAARQAPAAVASGPRGLGRDFGRLVHRLLEWIPLDGSEQAERMAAALAPSFGLDADDAVRAAAAVRRTLGTPLLERARRSAHAWRELQVWFPEGDELAEGQVDLVFEEDGQLVIVDYKTDQIAEADLLAQADHHAGQLQLYGRGLAQASGQSVKERLVLFTALGRAIPV